MLKYGHTFENPRSVYQTLTKCKSDDALLTISRCLVKTLNVAFSKPTPSLSAMNPKVIEYVFQMSLPYAIIQKKKQPQVNQLALMGRKHELLFLVLFIIK